MFIFYVLGAKWHFRRKLLTPAFHFKILEDFSTILINEGIIMAKTLSNTKGPVVKDLLPFISKHTLNTICGIVLYFHNILFYFI